MSSISVTLEGEAEDLLRRLDRMGDIDKRGMMQAVAEAMRTGVMDRFDRQEEPSGVRWKPSIRARKEGGKTLTKTAVLRTSISAASDTSGAAVGTNDIRAATMQFGDRRTIRPKRGNFLRFQIDGHYISIRKAEIEIPARPFLGLSEEDREEIRSILEEAVWEVDG